MFESPWLLLGLGLLVPVLAAFLFRQRDRLATVPSTLLFRRVALSRMKNRKLRSVVRRLALFACMAGVAGLVLAAADPRPMGATSSVAIVVDVSASMEGEPIDAARSAVENMLRQRDASEHITLIAAGSRPTHLVGPTTEPAVLRAAVGQLETESGEADLVAALELADRLTRSRRRGRIVVITDGGAAAYEDALSLDAPLSVLRVGEDRRNIGITVLAARPPHDATTDADRDVLVTVAASPGAARRVRVVLEADDTELERSELSVPGAGEAEVTFRLRAPVATLTARVEALDGLADGLPTDDAATLDVGTFAAPSAHLIAEDDAPSLFFVERALRATGITEIETHSPSDAPARIGDGELAVVLGAAPETRIEGPTLFLATTRGDLPVQIAAHLSGDEGTALRSIDEDHAVTRGVDLDEATIDAATAVELPRDAEGVVELDGGTVVALGGAGRGRWAYVGIDPSGSDLVLRVAFPVLVANAVATLAGATDVRVASTLPRTEVTLLPTAVLAGTPEMDAPWPMPAAPAFVLAFLAGALLLGEGLAFQRGWSR